MSEGGDKFIILTPTCNEEAYIGTTIDSMLKQTVKPLVWIIIDDGSTDRSLEIIREKTAGVPWIQVLTRPDKGYTGLDRAEEILALYDGLEEVENLDYQYIGKFDGDLELDPDYFERLLTYFYQNPRLGIACGSHWMKNEDGGYDLQRVLNGFVWGPVKFYRRTCLDDIGGFESRLGWDTHDVITARVKGWETQTFMHPRFFHNKGMGSRGGILKGKFRYGRTSYFLGYSRFYFLGRLAFQFFQKPVILASLAMLAGYFRAMIKREEIILNREEVRELRRIQRKALLGFIHGDHLTDRGYV